MSAAFGGDTDWPATDQQWLDKQKEDAFCAKLLEELPDATTRRCLRNNDQEDFFFRQHMLDVNGQSLGLGPVMRQFTKEDEYDHGDDTLIRQTIRRQMVIPKKSVHQCLKICHEGLAHPGRRKTEEVVQQRYYWPTIKGAVHDHIMRCSFCMRRKAPIVQRYQCRSITSRVRHGSGCISIRVDHSRLPSSGTSISWCLSVP